MTNLAAIDFGLSQTKLAARIGATTHTHCLPGSGYVDEVVFHNALRSFEHGARDFARIAVTGGQHAKLGARIHGTEIVHLPEAACAGAGGLALAGVPSALVTSAGSGTACIAARGPDCKHVFGTAVGGGTLIGLGRLLLGCDDPREIDALALAGAASGADLTIVDAVGGALDYLPADMTAVNFGRVGRGANPRRGDLAAALVTLVAQTISLVSISTARAERLEPIVFVGRLVELASMRMCCDAVARLYGTQFFYPADGGFAGVLGALELIA